MYLQYPCLDIDESPLDWWELKCKRMPLLSVAARKYLCVCAIQKDCLVLVDNW